MNSRFLIIQTAFAGDVILATPLIEKLKKFFPDSEIDFLVRKGNEILLMDHPKLNRVIVWEKKGKKILNLMKIIRQVRKNRYDTVICVQRFASAGLISILSGAKRKIGFDKNPFSFLFAEKIKHEITKGRHECERNLRLIESVTDDSFIAPKLYPSESDYNGMKSMQSRKYVCMAPASVWFTKQLPEQKWIELIEKINPDLYIYLTGSETDKMFAQRIIKASEKKNVFNFCGKLTFLETAALMEKAEMNYVNDSAPLHIASAMNAPVTVFFCSTVPEFGFGPLSSNSKIIQAEIELSCRPCGLHGLKQCPEKHFKCAESIQITKELA